MKFWRFLRVSRHLPGSVYDANSVSQSVRDNRGVIVELLWGQRDTHWKTWHFPGKSSFSQKNVQTFAESFMEESRSRNGVGLVGSATSFPTRAADSVSDSVHHSCLSFRCVIRSVSTCFPRGNLVDGLPRLQVACRDGDSSPLEEQHFIGQQAGKSWRKCYALFPKTFWQKSRLLGLLWSDLL